MTEPLACSCGCRTLEVHRSATFVDCVLRERRCAWCGERLITEERVSARRFRGNVRKLAGVLRRTRIGAKPGPNLPDPR